VRISLFNRKEMFLVRRFRFVALIVISVITLHVHPERAQAQAFYYQGQPFSTSQCTGLGVPAGLCVNGSLTASVFLPGVTSGYTGTTTNVPSWTMSADGVGTLTSGMIAPPGSQVTSFTLISGQITGWQLSAVNYVAGRPQYNFATLPVGLGGDLAEVQDTTSGAILAFGINSLQQGIWLSPVALGAPCASIAPTDAPPKPGPVKCGEPVDLGSGNMYYSDQDYSTVGQNPLSFTRYYNSMAVPDTYAVALGSNWRHNFDRYLHIINPSAIYGAVAERETGQYVSFSSSSGTYTSDTDLDYSLARSGSGPAWTWTLTAPDDTVETYSQSGSEATLSTIKRRNGYTQTMHYTSGRLSSVSDTYGRTVSMSYTSGLLTGLTTPDSLNLTYGYVGFSSGGHLLSTVAYNTSPATHQTYAYSNVNYPAALTGITDENGHSYSSWTYDSSGRMATSQLSGGVNFTSVSYFDTSGDRKVTGPLGITETYKFSPLQGVPKVTEIDRASNGSVSFASRGFTYDTNGFTQSATDWNGNQTWFTNNSHGLPTSIVFASGSTVSHTTSITYDTTWARLAHVITTPGLTITNNYAAGNGTLLTRVLADTTSTSIPYSTNGQTRTWTYTYTSTGQLASAQLPRTDVTAKTTFTYTGGVLTNIQDAKGHNTNVATYKPGGLPLTVRDVNHTLTTLAYSPRLWLTSSVLASSSGNLTTSITYDSAGELTKATLPDASFLSYAYNNAHLLTTITNRLSETQGLTYNSAGNLTQTLWKNSGGTTKRQHTATFDALGRMLTDVGGVSQTTTFGYDSDSNVLTITDPLSHVAHQTFDALNRLKTNKNAVLDTVTITYDAHDRPLTVKDGKTNTTTYVYDGFGEAISQVSPDSGTSVFWFDKDGNVSKQSAFAVTNYTYDALDRLLTRAYPADSTLNVALIYDQSGHGSGVGQLTSLTDQAGSLSLSYEQRGLVTSNGRTISSNVYTTGYTYESAGRLSGVTYASSGWKVSYVRDNAGQVSSVTDKPPSTAAVNLATSITHMPFGPVASLTYGNAVTDARTYDLDYRMTSVKDVGTGNVQYLSYGYDADNNVHTITDNVTTANNQTLTYDAIDRLKTATGVYGTISTITYDSNSNRLAYGATSYTIPSTSNKMSAAGGSSITYSSTGNITAIGTTPTFTWNKANQMATGVLSGTTSTYAYDAFGQRLKVTVGAGVPSVMENDQAGNILTETNSHVETDYAWLDGFPIAAIQPVAATVSAIHTDHLGTPQKATNAAKTIVFNVNYDPNGKASIVTNTITQNNRFPGQYADVTGFNHNGFRDYNPTSTTGAPRYLEVDPIGLAGGINPYIYGLNNPYRYTDTLGLCPAPYSNDCADESYGTELVTGALAVEVPAIVSVLNWIVNPPQPTPGGLTPEEIAAPQPPAETPGGQCTAGTPTGTALSPYRFTQPDETFFHHGYASQAESFANGLRPGAYATDVEGLNGAEAQAGLALPHSTPPDAVYTVTPTPGTFVRVNPIARPDFGQPGGKPEFQFIFGTRPGTVSGP
jgi:RHS repeat-associated protein